MATSDAHPFETFCLCETMLEPRTARMVTDGVPGAALGGPTYDVGADAVSDAGLEKK